MPQICSGFGSCSLPCAHICMWTMWWHLGSAVVSNRGTGRKRGWVCGWWQAWRSCSGQMLADPGASRPARGNSACLQPEDAVPTWGWNCSCQHQSSTIHGHRRCRFPPSDRQCHFGNASSPCSLHKTLGAFGLGSPLLHPCALCLFSSQQCKAGG